MQVYSNEFFGLIFFCPAFYTAAFEQLIGQFTELQRLLSGVHSVMRVKLTQAGEGWGARPPPFITFTITSKVAVYTPAEWADTLTLFHL